VAPNNYWADSGKYHVGAEQRAAYHLDPPTTSGGWYDLTVTIDGDTSWSQRFTGHLETGQPSITG
jgi:phospholipase C